MGILEDLISIDENGNVSYSGWVEWEHIPTVVSHCPVCLTLDKCWFNNLLKPELPQHENCHCLANTISKPVAKVNSRAKCDLKKFTDYIFGDKYAWNGKRDLFEMLGFTIKDSYYLQQEYEKQALENHCDALHKEYHLYYKKHTLLIKVKKSELKNLIIKSDITIKIYKKVLVYNLRK